MTPSRKEFKKKSYKKEIVKITRVYFCKNANCECSTAAENAEQQVTLA